MSQFSLAVSLAFLLTANVAIAQQQKRDVSPQDLNDSNNPLHPAITLNLHNFYIPDLGGPFERDANAFFLRGMFPFLVGDVPNLLRASIPVITEPTIGGDHTTGWGDLVIFDVAVFEQENWAWGLGPVIGVPTASDERFGNGKWTAGGAAAFVIPGDWGLFGMLGTYQKSFAGDDERRDVETLDVQPFFFYNLDDGFYLQSTASWTFDLEKHDWSIPVGLGIGKLVHVTDDVKMNIFVEPQFTVASEGVGPDWRIFAGVSFAYSLDKFIKQREH